MRTYLLAVALLATSCAEGQAPPGDGIPDAFPQRPDGEPGPDATPLPDAEVNDACSLALQALAYDFEAGAQGFVHAPIAELGNNPPAWPYDPWELGSPTSPACPSGSQCWGTEHDKNYAQCQRAYLLSPVIDLSDCGQVGQDIQLNFQHNYDFWSGGGGNGWNDGGRVEISANGDDWQAANLSFPGTIGINPDLNGFYCIGDDFYLDGKSGYVNSSAGWVSESFIIPAAMATVTFQVRFIYSSGVSSETINADQSRAATAPGWHVDDLSFQRPVPPS